MFSYEVGKPFGRGGPFQEGFELRMKGGPALLLFFRGLTPEETRGAREGRVWFGVAEEEGVLFFLFNIEGLTQGWADTPYHRALEERVLGPLELPELAPGQRLLLTLFLVSAEDGILRVMRVLSLTPEVSQALLQAVAFQGDLPGDYDLRIARVYARLTSEDLARRGKVGQAGE